MFFIELICVRNIYPHFIGIDVRRVFTELGTFEARLARLGRLRIAAEGKIALAGKILALNLRREEAILGALCKRYEFVMASVQYPIPVMWREEVVDKDDDEPLDNSGDGKFLFDSDGSNDLAIEIAKQQDVLNRLRATTPECEVIATEERQLRQWLVKYNQTL